MSPQPHPDFDEDELPPWEMDCVSEEQKSDDPDRRVLELVPASSVKIEQTRWAWTNRVPLGGVTLVAGQEGSGKTTIVGDILARATRGQLDGDLKGVPVGVVYATAEDSWSRTLAPRMLAAGADLDRVFFVRLDGLDGGLSIPQDLSALAARMKATGSQILVLDPLGAHLNAGLDTHRDAAVRHAIAPLASYMNELEAACLGIVHWSKAPTTVALDRVNGSRAFTAAARSMLAVAEDPEDTESRLLVLAKSNLGQLDVPALRYRIEGRVVVDQDGGDVKTSGVAWMGEAPGVTAHDVFSTSDPEERSDRSAMAEVINEVLTSGPRSRLDVLKAVRASGLDASEKTFQRACKSLGVERKRIGFGASFVLTLPYPDTSMETCPPVHNVHIGADQGLSSSDTGQGSHIGQLDRDSIDVSSMDEPPPDDSFFFDGEGF